MKYFELRKCSCTLKKIGVGLLLTIFIQILLVSFTNNYKKKVTHWIKSEIMKVFSCKCTTFFFFLHWCRCRCLSKMTGNTIVSTLARSFCSVKHICPSPFLLKYNKDLDSAMEPFAGKSMKAIKKKTPVPLFTGPLTNKHQAPSL